MDPSCIESPLIKGGGDFLENPLVSKFVENFYDFLEGASSY
jgi:hypothetical protein